MSKLLKILIIDDEPQVRNFLRNLITRDYPNLELVGEAENALKGIALIYEFKPDIVLLDIEMPGGNGFDLLKSIEDIFFKVIFITAFDHYAIRAIKFAAADYLLKPVDPEEFRLGIEKVKKLLDFNVKNESLKVLANNLIAADPGHQRIAVHSQEGIDYIELNQIIYAEADDNYTSLYLSNGITKVVSKTLKHFEDLLQLHSFYRCHRKYLINLNHVKAFIKKEGGYALMSNQKKLPIAIRRKIEFLKLIE